MGEMWIADILIYKVHYCVCVCLKMCFPDLCPTVARRKERLIRVLMGHTNHCGSPGRMDLGMEAPSRGTPDLTIKMTAIREGHPARPSSPASDDMSLGTIVGHGADQGGRALAFNPFPVSLCLCLYSFTIEPLPLCLFL